ncbi:hypothetical protein AMTR_s00080p00096310 [Amborella trichopoda]|uniref:Uncharacterized protein n=1 Tax=Amborella trichopoda TaxID=13333 RepID=W1P4V5_AMBTC|nr:hypothetical protein AMTR_s00080p00096310 [Amborella trichopoda]
MHNGLGIGDPSDAVSMSCKAEPKDSANGQKKHPILENNGFLKSCCTAVSANDVNVDTPESSIASDSTSSSTVVENYLELSEIHDHSDSGCSTDGNPDWIAVKSKPGQRPSRGPVTRLRSSKGQDKTNNAVGRSTDLAM